MKSVLLYLLLVGIPVAGVALVLRLGRSIVPPPYVGGTWRMTMSPDSLCRSDLKVDSLLMEVSQSGPHIAVRLADSRGTRLKGRAYGVHFRVSSSDAIHLHASVKRGTNQIRGILVGLPCSAARKTLLRGRRILAPNEMESH
jgi:hypothetical protein